MYDELLHTTTVVEELDRHTRVLYMKYVTDRCLLKTYVAGTPIVAWHIAPCIDAYRMVRAFDFVVLSHWFQSSNGSYSVVANSIARHDVGVQAGLNRGTIYSSGFHVVPSVRSTPPHCNQREQPRSTLHPPLSRQAESPSTKSTVTYISQANLGIDVPAFLLQLIQNSQPMVIASLARLVNQIVELKKRRK